MTKIAIVTGSARPGSVNEKVVRELLAVAKTVDAVEPTVIDVAELQLPFVNSPFPPSRPEYTIEEPAVERWSDAVKAADAVIFVMPEYNHSLSAIQKNAIDWLYSEWTDKPVGIVAYGFYAGKHTISQFMEMNTVLKMKLDDRIVGLQFNDDLGMDGSILEEKALHEKLLTLCRNVVAAAA